MWHYVFTFTVTIMAVSYEFYGWLCHWTKFIMHSVDCSRAIVSSCRMRILKVQTCSTTIKSFRVPALIRFWNIVTGPSCWICIHHTFFLSFFLLTKAADVYHGDFSRFTSCCSHYLNTHWCKLLVDILELRGVGSIILILQLIISLIRLYLLNILTSIYV